MNSKTHINYRHLYWLLLSATIVIVDQISKFLIVKTLVLQQSIQIIPFINFTLRHNTGSAFSFLQNAGGWQQIMFSGIAIVLSVVLTVALLQLPNQKKWLAAAFALIIGGALGNLCDRLILGYVVDFIDFYIGTWHFATFNVADSAITVGAVMLAMDMLFYG